MSKLGLTSIMAAAAFSLAACGGGEENNMAVENVEDLNATDDMNMGMDMNTDMNAPTRRFLDAATVARK